MSDIRNIGNKVFKRNSLECKSLPNNEWYAANVYIETQLFSMDDAMCISRTSQ